MLELKKVKYIITGNVTVTVFITVIDTVIVTVLATVVLQNWRYRYYGLCAFVNCTRTVYILGCVIFFTTFWKFHYFAQFSLAHKNLRSKYKRLVLVTLHCYYSKWMFSSKNKTKPRLSVLRLFP